MRTIIRTHIKEYAHIAGPLYALTGPKATFVWEEKHQQAFDALVEALVCAPVLAYPNSKDTFILDTDASDTAIGAQLLQLQEGEERVISYGSFSLTPAQRNYCTTQEGTPCSAQVYQRVSTLSIRSEIYCPNRSQ